MGEFYKLATDILLDILFALGLTLWYRFLEKLITKKIPAL
jgi:hypothetical protein